MPIREYLYENKSLNLAPYNYWLHDIKNIYLKFSTDDIIIDQDFPYNIIDKVDILINGQVSYSTNGKFIKSMIDVFHKPYNKYEYLVDIYLNSPLPVSLSGYSINLELGKDIKTYVVVEYFDKKPYVKEEEIQIKMTENQAELIKVNEVFEDNHIIESTLMSCGYINYLLFYVDYGLKIKALTLNLDSHCTQNYSYDQLNCILPYQYLGYSLPKNYLYLPFTTKEGEGGLNLNRIPTYSIKFQFKKCKGGNIYIMSESKNILRMCGGGTYFAYFRNICFSEYKWNNSTKLFYKIPLSYICSICHQELLHHTKFMECINCHNTVHTTCCERICPECNHQCYEYIVDELSVTI